MGVARLILALLVLLAAVPAAQANEGGSLSFPPQQLGAEPAVAEATLKNTTDYDLMLSPAPWFMGYDADAFDLRADNCAGRTLQSGESCTVEILFRPTHLGAFRSWLSYAVSAPGISHLYVTVNGETASPARITPGTLWMDPLPGEHNPLDFTVENVSDAPVGPLTCSTAPIPVDVSGCDGVTIPPGGSVTMTA